MSKVCLVTGANGHLGNNLVRQLLDEGYTVKAGVRDIACTAPFEGLNCELVYVDILDKASIDQALQGVDILFQVAAVFKHWATDPEKDIVQTNVLGTEIVLEAAARAKLEKVVYISSVAAVGHDGSPLSEDRWNTDLSNPYYRSKILSEKKAYEVANRHGLWMVVILPAAMVGPNCFKLTPTMEYIRAVLKNELPFDPQFFFNFVDVRDVARGSISAMSNGQSGERYILANIKSLSMDDVVTALNTDSIALRVRTRAKAPKWLLLLVAWVQETVSMFSRKEASLTVSQVKTFFNVHQEYDISKARNALQYSPAMPSQAIKAAGEYLSVRL
ncbi:Aurachin B dehydrogenase [Zhongshania aliphaticivorans]|uniref:Aurachin B dehydrogenase n=1 Tax=Zhongshania aliphaticivorans TaxID=1470434 RepID=A0A5S9PHC3_9GAMM|nr:NAD-dependent epimerase/dehydratase family protein [Zhongshania aliphaticivorans]CAA0103532.1 Aurachin B dehydrogenase [Zhongshania aliphaticivorans]CAA0113448.1 Aurachin B dehydrogenase [Zhongshania aliphaticivorans]